MQKPPATPPKGGFSVHDIIFVLFKHKWMILGLSLLGLGGAAYVHHKRVPIYQSQAKLLLEYVLQRGTVDTTQSVDKPGGGGRRGGDPVINTEIEILTSDDLAYDVAEDVGVEVLAPDAAAMGVTDSDAVVGVVKGGMEVTTGRSRNVIYVNFGHENPKTAQYVLGRIVEHYKRRHLETHRSAARYEMVASEADAVKADLDEAQGKLDDLRMQSGIMTLGDATNALSSLRTKTQEDLMNARAELAELMAGIGLIKNAAPNPAAANAAGQPGLVQANQPSAKKVAEFQSLNEIIALLRKRDVELQVKFKPGHPLMMRNQAQINQHEAKRQALIESYPIFAQQAVAPAEANPGQPSQFGPAAHEARIATVKAKIQLFETQLKEIGEQFKTEYQIGVQIEALEAETQALKQDYYRVQADLKAARIDKTLDPSRMPNIEPLQEPSKPVKTYDDLSQKIVLGLAGGGLALGLGLAFLIELLLDRRVKRPVEIQTKLQLPLLLTIPYIRKKSRGLFLSTKSQEADAPRLDYQGEEETDARYELSRNADMPNGRNGLSASQGEHFILPYTETIRDRIIFNFEINNMTHKPKLVAVTGLSQGAGSSTVAAGMAKSFSDITGMKVLLVDLSSFHPEDSPLFGEVPRHSLNSALRLADSEEFRSNKENLYYASAPARRDDSGLTTFSPVHLYELMPHLQKSDYDYIIFDMPPVDQTSRTLTMAGMMDKVLLVLDAENTSRDGLMWGFSELVKGRADVSCIFNKSRSHVPEWLVGSQ